MTLNYADLSLGELGVPVAPGQKLEAVERMAYDIAGTVRPPILVATLGYGANADFAYVSDVLGSAVTHQHGKDGLGVLLLEQADYVPDAAEYRPTRLTDDGGRNVLEPLVSGMRPGSIVVFDNHNTRTGRSIGGGIIETLRFLGEHPEFEDTQVYGSVVRDNQGVVPFSVARLFHLDGKPYTGTRGWLAEACPVAYNGLSHTTHDGRVPIDALCDLPADAVQASLRDDRLLRYLQDAARSRGLLPHDEVASSVLDALLRPLRIAGSFLMF
jgi:hypothetical protein